MRKALITMAVGEKYMNMYNYVRPTFQEYADRHGWELHLIDGIPDEFREKYSRPERPFPYYWCNLYKLMLPQIFSEYDLCLFVDSDCVINPQAPDIAVYADSMPTGGFAAAPDIYYEDRARYFPHFRTYHYDDYIAQGLLDEQVPNPKLHINAGILLFSPDNVRNRWSELLELDTWMHEECRFCVYEVQQGRVFILPKQWHCAYIYEKVRRGFPNLLLSSNTRLARLYSAYMRRIMDPFERRLVNKIVDSNYITHFVCEHRNIYMVDIDSLVAPAKDHAVA